ncbi:response regulator [Derxia gummosa]|uniref:Sensory/regulatory protein RpfC n=1 Tax=Derxia gummosa DSM 723 TaxID=1121388 RepID=A0A8B6X9N5_9BURK|nr:response regulator [Derxia gummosa]
MTITTATGAARPAPKARRHHLLAALVWAVFVAALALLAGRIRLNAYYESLSTESGERAIGAVRSVETSFRQWSALAVMLSHQSQVTDYARRGLGGPPCVRRDAAGREQLRATFVARPEVRAISAWLDSLRADFPVQQATITDGCGVSTAHSGLATGVIDTIGRDLSARPAISAALADGRGYMYSVGTQSGRRGFSFGARIGPADRPQGVLLIKFEPEAFEHLFAEGTGDVVVMTDADGVILSSNRAGLELRRLPFIEPAAGADARMRASFRDLPAPLDWQPLALPSAAIEGGVSIDDRRHLLRSSKVPGYPYRVWVLRPLDDETSLMLGSFNFALLLVVLGWGALAISWRAHEREHVVGETRRELLDMIGALPLTLFRYRVGPEGERRFLFLGGRERPFGDSIAAEGEAAAEPWRRMGLDPDAPPVEPVLRPVAGEGGQRWIATHSHARTESDGHSRTYDGYWLDETERHAAVLRFESAFANAPIGFVFFDPEEGIRRCNPAAVRLFGATSDRQLIGLKPWEPPLSPPVQPDGRASATDAPADFFAALERDGIAGPRDWTHERLDGGPSGILSVTALRLADSGPGRFFSIMEDVSARRQSEQALQAASQAALDATRAKSAFLANMSHEIRTPMNAIIGMTQLALIRDPEARNRDQIEKAHRAALDLLQLLDDVLDMSKIEAGRMELEHIEFDPERVLADALDLLAVTAERKGLELLADLDGSLPAGLVGDPMRLRQVIVNLGGNAIKFTERGSVTIGLTAAPAPGGGVLLSGWVRDTGIGIAPPAMTRLFEPFSQADGSTTRRFGGSGLGLSICREIVQHMHGRIWAESRPGEGSTFHFHVRLALGAGASRPNRWHEMRGARLLLVDDSADAREVIGAMAEGLGLAVDRAADGISALALASAVRECWDWLLIDWRMPGIDGIETARQLGELLAARFAGRVPKLLLVTASDRVEALRAAAGSSVTEVLAKPVTPSSLHDCLLRTRLAPEVRATATPNGARADMAATADASARPAPAADGADPAGGAVLQGLADPPAAVPVTPEADALRGLRVLVVDDNPVNLEVARELLRHAGVEVTALDSGTAALARLDADAAAFDCVLLDVQMPGMDGHAVVRAIRERPALAGLPVIAMTADVLAEDRARAFDAGMDDHLGKPLDVVRLYATLGRWARRRRQGRWVTPARR